jgi:diaminopimelate epimerase
MIGENRLRLRVYERGTGFTLACGSGACAAGVAAARLELAGRKVEVVVEHGTLIVEWMRDGRVSMTGGTALSYKGEL